MYCTAATWGFSQTRLVKFPNDWAKAGSREGVCGSLGQLAGVASAQEKNPRSYSLRMSSTLEFQPGSLPVFAGPVTVSQARNRHPLDGPVCEVFREEASARQSRTRFQQVRRWPSVTPGIDPEKPPMGKWNWRSTSNRLQESMLVRYQRTIPARQDKNRQACIPVARNIFKFYVFLFSNDLHDSACFLHLRKNTIRCMADLRMAQAGP